MRFFYLILLLVGGLSFAGKFVWSHLKTESLETIDQEAFYTNALGQINEQRKIISLSPVERDDDLQKWVVRMSERVSWDHRIRSSDLLSSLEETMPSVQGASVYVTYGKSSQEISDKLSVWEDTSVDEHTHFSSSLFQTIQGGNLGCVTLLARKLPPFKPELLNQNVQLFYSRCKRCSRTHAIEFRVFDQSNTRRLECPHCKRYYDLLARDPQGEYRRVTHFLGGYAPAADFPQELSKFEEMFAIWEAVLAHCEYQHDSDDPYKPQDRWQLPEETHARRAGDCEDSSLLLVDWLRTRGFDARMALGKTSWIAGHAWCVVRLEGREYILETTEALPDKDKPPYAESLRKDYHPEYLFDHANIYFRSSQENVPVSYWSPDDWVRVHYSQESELAAAEGADPHVWTQQEVRKGSVKELNISEKPSSRTFQQLYGVSENEQE